MSPALADPNLGTTLDDRYRIDHLLALGGMSRIYRGMDKRLHRAIVVKILNDNFASEATVRERFESEAVIAANITHPNVVSIRDHNVTDNIVYLVMEYVRGRNLEQVISERGRFTPRQMLSVLEQVCNGLSAAHQEGIIHRDMKPANVLLADSGEVKVTDFGLARAASAHTQSATLVATLSHVSPELVSGAPADSRSDIYAVGIMIYQMLTGRLPYSETNAAALMKHHLDSPMPLPSDVVPGLATDLDELVQWCTEKDPEKRPQNAGLLLDEVIQIRSTLSDEQLDFDAETLGGIDDLTPGAITHMPTTLQQRLDAMQREREEERERQWQLRGASAGVQDYSLDTDVDPEATTVIAASEATEVLDLRDSQATVVHSPHSGASSGAPEATAAYSRSDLDSFGQGNHGQPERAPSELSHRGQKRAEKAAQKQWRKEAQVPTHLLHKPKTTAQKAGVVVAWILIVGLLAGAGWFFGRGPGTVIRIPSLNGLLQDQAVTQMSEQGIPVRLGSAFDDDIAIGRVVNSHPATGENIMKFQGVELIVSQGPEQFEIPELKGKSLEAATEVLAQHELTKVKNTSEYSSDIEKGKVISSSPAAGKSAARKDTITLTVSQGPAPVEVPQLLGLSQEEAAAALESVGLRLEIADPVHSSDVPQGRVAAQSPHNNTAEVGSAVTVNLSQGPEFVEIPSVIGLGVEEASRILEEAGFTVKTHNVLGGFSQTVRMQSPLNQQAELGTQISIYAF
ncbi:PASTA domain-containing protein [Glutamicibacter sp. NPDC087344]|uniref:Stk1 family PASTA domain-containing Ser/Thr kinase n=1 Tax=Glutamicibacter sp. NPDC087344 TaxID=3363994 RepID=UPI0037FEA99F